ncbi:dynamin-like GTPase mgm1 [Apophysomyces sp. BC1021]|nr:dynamin-like GTPase mgm1 [Apophysomyces sp. BC1021]
MWTMRLPVILAGTTVAGFTMANNTLQEWKDRGIALTAEAQQLLSELQERIGNVGIAIPETHLQVPNAVKRLLASINSSSTTSTTHRLSNPEQLQQQTIDDPRQLTGNNNGGENPQPAAMVREDQPILKKALSQSSIIPHDEQLMALTRKLIEIRGILTSIGHGDTLTLPSIVMIGSQSSGKSSVLEAIVGLEFLPKGSNFVTRRPIELTLVHTHGGDQEYGEFPQLGLGKIYDFKEIQQTLKDLNLAVPSSEGISEEPIKLCVYSSNVPDLTLIDLPGYIQLSSETQSDNLSLAIERLCEKYIQGPNLIMAVCAADVDLANSPALNASRKHDPLGLRTLGIITKLDLVDPKDGLAMLRNTDYPLHLGYVGVACNPSREQDQSSNIYEEELFFHDHLMYNQRDIQTGTATMRHKLTSVLEQSMGRSLYTIVDAVRKELEEARYQFKVIYNDCHVTPQSYVAETMDKLKQNFKDFASRFGKPQVRAQVRTMLEQRMLDICAEQYWSDPNIVDLPMARPEDFYWLYKIDLASAALTKSGVGRATTQLVVDVLMRNMEHLVGTEPFTYHHDTQRHVIDFTSDILSSKFLTTSDQVENTIKPYKYEIEVTGAEWTDGVKRAVLLLEKELAMCEHMADSIKRFIGKTELRRAIKHVLDSERVHAGRMEQLRESNVEDEEETLGKSAHTRILEQAKKVLFLRDRAMILKYRIASLKSRQCSSAENKQYCPEAFLNVIAEKLTYTAVMFIQVELLNEFFFQFPREVDDRLVYHMNRKQMLAFAQENPPVQKHLELQERKLKLEEVMHKLDYLARRQADR